MNILRESPILFMQFSNISKKYWSAFFLPSKLFSDIKAKHIIIGPKFYFFFFIQKIIECLPQTSWDIFELHVFDCWCKLALQLFFLESKTVFSPGSTLMMLCAIWYHLFHLKDVKNTHEGVLLLTKFQPLRVSLRHVFCTFFKLYKWYQIAQSVSF